MVGTILGILYMLPYLTDILDLIHASEYCPLQNGPLWKAVG